MSRMCGGVVFLPLRNDEAVTFVCNGAVKSEFSVECATRGNCTRRWSLCFSELCMQIPVSCQCSLAWISHKSHGNTF